MPIPAVQAPSTIQNTRAVYTHIPITSVRCEHDLNGKTKTAVDLVGLPCSYPLYQIDPYTEKRQSLLNFRFCFII